MSTADENELHELDLRIRAITFILHKLAPQAAHPSRSPKARDPHLVAATHIATILTRGVTVGQNGAFRIGPSIRPIAVTAHISSKALNIYASEEDYAFTQNSLNGDKSLPTIELQPTSGTVSDIINRQVISSALRLLLAHMTFGISEPDSAPHNTDLIQHGSDIVGIVNGFAHTPRDDDTMFQIQTFITRRCAPIIAHRLKCDKFIFGATTLLDIIEGWQPTENDTLVLTGDAAESPTQFQVKRFLADMAQRYLGIPFETRGDECYCDATTQTAALWIRLLHGILTKLKRILNLPSVEKGRPTADFADVTVGLTHLWCLLKMRGFRNILEIGSLHARLANAILRKHTNRTTHDVEAGPAHPQPSSVNDNIVDPEEEAELDAKNGETPVSLTLRYLENVVACLSATNALLRSKAIIGENAAQLHLRLVNTTPPLEPNAMDNAWKTFCTAAGTIKRQSGGETTFKQWQDAWKRELTASDPPSTTDSTPRSRNPSFSGAIHCEAALMGAIAYNELEGLNATPHRSPAIPIGVATGIKSCWCCAELGRLIGEKHGLTFLLPSSHGRVLEWALPKGVSVEVARALVESLDAMLVKAVVHDYTDKWRLPIKQTIGATLSEASLGHASVGLAKAMPFNPFQY